MQLGPAIDFESLVGNLVVRPQMFLVTGTFEEALGFLGAARFKPCEEFIVWVNRRFGQPPNVVWLWTVYEQFRNLPARDAINEVWQLVREFSGDGQSSR